ncbi:thioesterase II family protein [Streptomyces sp. ICN988]|uniref:thioesterase II family protein n=1 Tax=Streptomyces sp. ICN988 TaxID=2983765 RepID=UPI00398D0290
MDGPPLRRLRPQHGRTDRLEQTHRLAQSGRPPTWTGLSSCGAPRTTEGTQARHQRTPTELGDALRTTGGTPEEILDAPRLCRLFEPVFRNDCAPIDTWQPAGAAARLPVAVSAFGGIDDTVVSRDRLAAWSAHTHRCQRPARVQRQPLLPAYPQAIHHATSLKLRPRAGQLH